MEFPPSQWGQMRPSFLADGKSRMEALRCLKRHLARVVYRLLSTPPAANRTGERIPVETAPFAAIYARAGG